jgi:uncharacterized protein YegL
MATESGAGRSRIDELNDGLKALEAELRGDPTAKTRVQLAIVCVGGAAGHVDVMLDWTDAKDFHAFDLAAGGATPLGSGLELALDIVAHQKRAYRANGISYLRPWMMVISDGEPTDEPAVWRRATGACRAAEQANQCVIYPIGVADANVTLLQQISANEVKQLRGLSFVELFVWLSASLSVASRSAPGERVQLASTSAWESVRS